MHSLKSAQLPLVPLLPLVFPLPPEVEVVEGLPPVLVFLPPPPVDLSFSDFDLLAIIFFDLDIFCNLKCASLRFIRLHI
jgi:hypothetical protein